MSKAKVKVTVQSGRKGSGKLIASMPIAIVKNTSPSGQRLYQTKAQLNAHIYRGQRPKTPRLRRAN